MRAIRLAVIDEHTIFRRGVIECLAEDRSLEVVPEGSVDLNLVVCSAAAASRNWAVPVVCCIDEGEATGLPETVMAALDRNTVSPDELIGAVHAVAAGLAVHGRRAPSALLRQRERDVLLMLSEGAATREISTELGYCERTIKSVIAGLEEHFDARTRAHTVAKAIRSGVI